MAAISIVTTGTTAPSASTSASANGASAAESANGFAALLAGSGDDSPVAPGAASSTLDRQDLAVSGKDLPDDDRDHDDKDQTADGETDAAAALIWLALAVPTVAPAVTASTDSTPKADVSTVAAATGPASAGPSAPNSAAVTDALPGNDNDGADAPPADKAPAATPTAPSLDAKTAAAAAAPRDPVAILADALRDRLGKDGASSKPAPDAAATAIAAAATAKAAIASNADATSATPVEGQSGATTAPAAAIDGQPRNAAAPANAAATPALANVSNTPAAPIIGSVQPAAQAFAAALHTPQPVARRSNREESGGAFAVSSTGATDTRLPTLDAAPAGTIDTRHAKWVDGIIDHIELLKDAANAGDTRIRLLPDALGKIDVSIRKDGDTVNVRFSSESAPTRQLIADAQPRLAEIAAGRGLRLGQTLIDSGDSATGQQQRQSAQQQAQDPRQPIANARRVMADDSEQPDDAAATSGWLA